MTTTDSAQPALHTSSVTRPRRRGRSILSFAKFVAALLGGVAIALATGAVYERIASSGDTAAYPPSGKLINVGGHQLHLDCRGEGSPAIVMDAGLGGSSLDWSLVAPELAQLTKVCTYDRAGMGWSEPGPLPRSPSRLADELFTLLKTGGVEGPYVMVGHSLAGKIIRLFAAGHPADVVGMILVDARSETIEANSDMETFAKGLEAQGTTYSLARTFGIARLFGGATMGLPLVPPALATQMALFATDPAAIAETTAEGLSRIDDDPVLATQSLGSMPLAVVAAGENMQDPEWATAQDAMSKLSTRGQLIIAHGSGHAVHLQSPAIVIDAIRSVMDEVSRS